MRTFYQWLENTKPLSSEEMPCAKFGPYIKSIWDDFDVLNKFMTGMAVSGGFHTAFSNKQDRIQSLKDKLRDLYLYTSGDVVGLPEPEPQSSFFVGANTKPKRYPDSHKSQPYW